INCGSVCSATYDNEPQVTLQPTPDQGWSLSGWGGDGGPQTCTVAMTADRSVRATFGQLIGTVASMQPSGTFVRYGISIPITTGAAVYLNDLVITDSGGKVQVLLLDDTVFTLGPNSEMVIDTFVFDPATENGTIVAKLLRGFWRFVTEKVARPDPANKILLPVGEIGIRGTDFTTQIDRSGNAVT